MVLRYEQEIVARWNENKLETQLYRTNLRASLFWEQIVKDPGRGLLNHRKRFSQGFLIPIVECNVIRRRRVGF